MRLLQVIGTNGSGKSSLLRAIVESDPAVRLYEQHGRTFTVAPNVATLAIGDYLSPNKTPGADRIRTKELLLASLDAALVLASASGYRTIAWEGIMLMTRQYHPQYLARSLSPFYAMMDTPLDECFNRIEARSGHSREGLKKGGGIVTSRAASAAKLMSWFESQGAATLWLRGDDPLPKNALRVVEALGEAVPA